MFCSQPDGAKRPSSHFECVKPVNGGESKNKRPSAAKSDNQGESTIVTLAFFCRDNLYPAFGLTVISAVSFLSFRWSNVAVNIIKQELEPAGIVIWPPGVKLLPNV
jgi:hypothetical protein